MAFLIKNLLRILLSLSPSPLYLFTYGTSTALFFSCLLKYPETVKVIKNPLGTTAFHLKDNQHKYTYAVVGYLPADKPRYILLLTAHDFTKSSGSMQGISFLHQQWKSLETKFNSMVK